MLNHRSKRDRETLLNYESVLEGRSEREQEKKRSEVI